MNKNQHYAMKMFVWLFVYLNILTFVIGSRLTYEGSQVFQLQPHTSAQLRLLQQLQNNEENEIRDDGERIDIWKSSNRIEEPWEILVPAKHLPGLEQILQEAYLEREVLIENVADAIQEEKDKNQLRQKREILTEKLNFFKKFRRYEEIKAWLEMLARKYPQYVRKQIIGKSAQGRDIILMKLGNSRQPRYPYGFNRRRKQVIWMDGGIHAREWIAPAVVMYLMDRILKTEKMLRYTDFYIIPLVNPDGYEYSHTNDRMWRKNRAPSNVSSCSGVDLNRNWDFKWMESGSSANPCSDTYAGIQPGSEPEIQAITRYINTMPYLDVYLTFHSYGQVWLSPWGYTNSPPPNEDKLKELAMPAVQAANKRYGKKFEYAQAGVYFPPASGAADDWAYNLSKVTYSYTIELRDTGISKFFLDPQEIIPSGREMWAALVCLNSRLRNSSYTCNV